MKLRFQVGLAGLSGLAALSCVDPGSAAGTGKLRVLLQAEASITNGLSQGPSLDDTADYSVRYSKYLVTVGNVRLGKSASDASAALPAVFVADLKQVGEQGVELGVLDNLEAGQWDQFGYATPAATRETRALGDVSEADLATMRDRGLTYWIEGEVLRAAADGGPVSFVIQAEADTVFSGCEVDGEPGVSVVEDGTVTAKITLHGDHLFFNAFPTGSEGSIRRLAAWVIEADQDGDGKVTSEDLRALDASEVFTSTAGYSLDGKPRQIEINNALDFVRAQLATQGHLNGEGECQWRYAGASGG